MEPLGPIEEAPAATGTRARLAAIAVALFVAVALLAVVLVQSGDGKPQDGDPIGTARPEGSATTTPGEAGTTTIAPGSTPTTSPGAGTAGAPTTTAPPPSIPSSPDDYKYQVTLSATCVHPGESMTIVMHIEPEATGAMMVLYSDNQSHEAKHHGVAGPDGRLSYTFVVTPTLGKATVYTSAQRRSDGKAGTTTATFEVVDVTRSC